MNITDEHNDVFYYPEKRYCCGMLISKKMVTNIVLGITAFATLVFACIKGPTAGASLTVLSERCFGCRQCATVCNADAIYFVGNKAVIDPTKCIECLKCVDACPKDAIH